jgi:membrane associated rhomboid family serine protease
MSFHDRDYARGGASGGGGYSPYDGPSYRYTGGRPSYLIQGSVVTTLIAINVVVFLLAAINPKLQELIYGFGVMQAEAVMHGQVWRLVTAQYLHAGMGHILFNMIALHFLGRPLERMWSARRFFGIYTMCGLAGNIFYTILGSKGVIPAQMPAVGASGSIYGLLGIVAVLFPTATVYVYFLFPIRIRTAAYIFGAIAVFSIIVRGSNYGGEACHLAGLLFGVWWALHGDKWWSETEWRFLPRKRDRYRSAGDASGNPNPGGWARKVQGDQADQQTVDRILKKVYDQGIHSLSEQEKRVLRAATDRQQGV